MSWECGEGPGGLYPGEPGYEESLVQHSIKLFEDQLNWKHVPTLEWKIFHHINSTLKKGLVPWIDTRTVWYYANQVKYFQDKYYDEPLYLYADSHFEPRNRDRSIVVIDRKTEFSSEKIQCQDVPVQELKRIISESKQTVVFSPTKPQDHGIEAVLFRLEDYESEYDL